MEEAVKQGVKEESRSEGDYHHKKSEEQPRVVPRFAWKFVESSQAFVAAES